jgi:hypothetical protein
VSLIIAPLHTVVDVSRPVSWVLRVTIVPLELYIISLGLVRIHTVRDDSKFLLLTESRPNELGGGRHKLGTLHIVLSKGS